MPKRIQRKRTKGWKMPEGSVYVGRPTKWGNPLFGDPCAFRAWLVGNVTPWTTAEGAWLLEQQRSWILSHIHELRGKDLACWCPPGASCHADVLLELANQEADE